MSIITAPDGAIFALLAFANAAPIVPDETAEIWLREQFLIEDTPHGVAALTTRGAAFIRIINATPLPVKVERWDDPRDADRPPAPASAPPDAFAALTAALVAAMRQAPAPAIQAAPRPAPPGAVQAQIVTSIPPGYTAVPDAWKTTPMGLTPAGLRPDAELRVIYADGRISGSRAAQSIIWLHRGIPDDPIAYAMLGNDTIVPMG